MYHPSDQRYETMSYRRCGRSGLRLSSLSLGLWHNFGGDAPFQTARAMIHTAFDAGITHFDLANNYGPPPGSAESNFGRILQEDLKAYRDELIISSKAGYDMWPGPYGNFGSRKSLIASCEQSLRRMGLDYVDIFYHHRPDPDTPLAETMGALDHLVRSGKALYVGISNYGPAASQEAASILRRLGTPCLIHQPCYHMFRREPEQGLFSALEAEGMGAIAFSPLAQGILTDKYLSRIPEGSRAAKGRLRIDPEQDPRLEKVRQLSAIAEARGMNIAQLALAWVLRHPVMASVIIGASRPEQIRDCLGCLRGEELSSEELAAIDAILASAA
ncbi:MAG: L-glyceraldehyde 3-phosphate reductase [Planctomycetota bacterium]|nr:MAG: L-glyceraldehyde 3-phosphate reductase [Planctomycetota bacterium]